MCDVNVNDGDEPPPDGHHLDNKCSTVIDVAEQFETSGSVQYNNCANDTAWNTNVNLNPPSSSQGNQDNDSTELKEGDSLIDLEAELEATGLALYTNFANYTGWRVDVNLNPPPGCQPNTKLNERVKGQYFSLQYTLYETGHPETVDRTNLPRKDLNAEGVVVAVLSTPQLIVGLMLKGGSQLPDGFHLILSSSWFKKVPSKTNPGLYSLYLYKAITFANGGSSFLDEFATPRRVTYLMSYFTCGLRNDGPEIERNLDCPMSSSKSLCERVDDKVYTRIVMAGVGVDVPETLGLLYRPKRNCFSKDPRIRTMEVHDHVSSNSIRHEVARFLADFPDSKKIVVKPSGPRFCSSIGVTFHQHDDIDSIMDAVDCLYPQLEDGDSILVETFIEHISPRRNVVEEPINLWSTEHGMGFRTRATVCRDHDNVPVCLPIICAIGSASKPINGDNSIPESLDSTLRSFNYHDSNVVAALEQDIRAKSEAVLQALMDEETNMSLEEKGELRAQTDLISIDYVLTDEDGVLKPFAIEVNSHDCLFTYQSYEFIIGNCGILSEMPNFEPREFNILERGDVAVESVIESDNDNDQKARTAKNNLSPSSGSRLRNGSVSEQTVMPLIRTMIARSQQFLMIGKKILVLNAMGPSKRKLLVDSRAYGVKLVVVDSDAAHSAKDDVYKFIHYDLNDHKLDDSHAINILNLMKKDDIVVDGCTTFWEDCVPLAAIIRARLKTRGPGVFAATSVKKKSSTHNILSQNSCGLPHYPEVRMYATPCFHIGSKDDLEKICDNLTYPKVLKLEYGCGAVGVQIVHGSRQLKEAYDATSRRLQKDEDFPGIGLSRGNGMLVMDFIGGSEHDVDLVIYDRKLVAAFVSDNGPTNFPVFLETAAVMPSTLPRQKQLQLITAAYQCCVTLGLCDGVYNVEMKMQSTGPKLIEINGRMGGFYLREWIRHIYGTDLMLCELMITCGIKPFVPKMQPKEYLMGIMLFPHLHADMFRDPKSRSGLEDMENRGEILIKHLGAPEDEYEFGGVHEQFASIAVRAPAVKEAKRKLLKLCDEFSISQPTYDVSHYIQYF